MNICSYMENQTKSISSFNKDKAIGDNGETAVSFLIRSMQDWRCTKFGVENHIEQLKEMVRETFNPVTKKIKSMPDFVAFNTKTKETLFLEVKYRSNSTKGKYLFRHLNEYNEYWPGTKLIIVRPNEPYFVCIDLDKINRKMKTPLELNPGEWREYWDFNDIEQNIKAIFPELSEEAINTAIEMIPKKNGK